MMSRVSHLIVAVLFLTPGSFQHITDAQNTVNATKTSVVIKTSNGSIQVYPPVDVRATDFCPDASWKHWGLHTVPPSYDPLHWSNSQWRDYLVKYPLRSAGLSIAFLLIGLGALLVAVTWRVIQWCVSCGHCQRGCGVRSDDGRFLRDMKHRYLKAWIYVLIAGALGMVVWGMLALDRHLMASFWDTFTSIMKYGENISSNLELLKDNITVTVPDNMEATAQFVNRMVNASRLESLAQASFEFNNATLTATSSLFTAAGSFLAALNDRELPGLAALASQFGSPIDAAAASSGSGTTSRRRLSQSVPSNDTLYALLPALKSSLPVVISANSTRASITSRLQALAAALAAVQSTPVLSTNSSSVLQLTAALTDTSLDLWDSQLAQIVSGLQVYNVSRSGAAFGEARQAAGDMVAGSGLLSSAAVTQLTSRVGDAANQISRGPALGSLKVLRLLLLNISQQVTDVGSWGVQLDNGTDIGILDMSNFLVGGINDYIMGDTSNGLGATLSATGVSTSRLSINTSAITNVTTFLQAARSISSLAASLNVSATAISSAAASAANAAASGPSPDAAASQVTSVLRPALASITSPVAAVAAALSQYSSNPSLANAQALRIAVANASSPVNDAVASFAPPLANATALEAVFRSLQPLVDTLQGQGSSFTGNSSYTYDRLTRLGGEVGRYQAGVGLLSGLVAQLPDGSVARAAMSSAASGIQNKVTEVSADVDKALNGVASKLDSALYELDSKVLSPANTFVNDNQQRTEDINKIAYSAVMGAWGLGAALLLLLALSVYFNWTGGLVTFGLALLLYITLSQVVTSVVSFAMAALDDACNDVETVMLRQLVEHSTKPQVAVLLSYYLYKVPTSPDVMLQAAFDLNVTDVRQQLNILNQTLTERIESSYSLRGMTAVMVNVLRDLGTQSSTMFEAILNLFHYETIHLLYMNTKSLACCDAGNFAYHEWCAITAMAALAFGALIAAAYLLSRMDMVVQRPHGCCSCCSCVCYKPNHGIREDEEAAQKEDEFVKDPKKKQDMHRYPQSRQPQQQLANPLFGSKSNGGEGAPKAAPGPQDGQLPTGFMTAAGGAAATAALTGVGCGAYSAPSAPPMSSAK